MRQASQLGNYFACDRRVINAIVCREHSGYGNQSANTCNLSESTASTSTNSATASASPTAAH
jgi:hypothetical protein